MLSVETLQNGIKLFLKDQGMAHLYKKVGRITSEPVPMANGEPGVRAYRITMMDETFHFLLDRAGEVYDVADANWNRAHLDEVRAQFKERLAAPRSEENVDISIPKFDEQVKMFVQENEDLVRQASRQVDRIFQGKHRAWGIITGSPHKNGRAPAGEMTSCVFGVIFAVVISTFLVPALLAAIGSDPPGVLILGGLLGGILLLVGTVCWDENSVGQG